MAQPARSPISAGTALRRSLLIWGWGQVSVGDKRGYLFAILQILAIADWLIIAAQFIDTTAWLALFVPLVAIAVVWIGQAVAAYRRALALGGAPGGEFQLALFLPVLLAAFSSFWIVGGHGATPASTVEAYMEAWESNRPDLALPLLVVRPSPQDPGGPGRDLMRYWHDEGVGLQAMVADAQATYGSQSGLDPSRPFSSLRVRETSDPSIFAVELVRSESFQTTLLGIIPTSGQRTVVISPIVDIGVVEVPTGSAPLASSVWLIDYVSTQTSP